MLCEKGHAVQHLTCLLVCRLVLLLWFCFTDFIGTTFGCSRQLFLLTDVLALNSRQTKTVQ